ncbi:3,4-dihydroxy-2-butanone-4-phosphate synthase [Thermogymnomonas acidicola]|nr:3,4-dihydroxy-2-butanone-4-phosphate synthase [Thermogymnomonas acidicola]
MLTEIAEELRAGRPVLVYDFDGRERETDIVFASQFITPEKVRFMRKYGGGLICTTVTEEMASAIGLPYLEDVLRTSSLVPDILLDASDLKYDRNSSFSLTVNHRNTFTGIPDVDRALTISEFARFLGELEEFGERATVEFARRFRSPGHVILLIAREGYFGRRRGHTELSTYLVESAGLIPSATIVEMLSDTGRSMTKEEAMAFASQNSLKFIEGKAIVEEWADGQGNGHGGLRHTAPRPPSLSEGE